MKYFWRVYYFFVPTKGKSELAIAFARTQGLSYIKLKLNRRNEDNYL